MLAFVVSIYLGLPSNDSQVFLAKPLHFLLLFDAVKFVCFPEALMKPMMHLDTQSYVCYFIDSTNAASFDSTDYYKKVWQKLSSKHSISSRFLLEQKICLGTFLNSKLRNLVIKQMTFFIDKRTCCHGYLLCCCSSD